MTPRHPPESLDDDEKQIKRLPAIHNALNYTPLVHGPADAQSRPGEEQDAPRLVKPEDVEVEIDRMEAYLKGPTAFTA